jgi:CRISPR-associated protein Cas5d
MGEPYPPVAVKVWSDMACFTRPEFKVERVSYEVMTPSAARGVLEAIFWKPEFEWRVRKIEVLKPIRHFSLLRNEVNRKAVRDDGFSAPDFRSQRHTLALREVAYIIHADVAVKPGVGEGPEKYRDQFHRRVKGGRSFHRPYLGCREYAAHFSKPEPEDCPIDMTANLGLMLFDLEYGMRETRPRFFQARLEDGVLNVPRELYKRRAA